MRCHCGTKVEDGFNGTIVHDKHSGEYTILCYGCEDDLEVVIDRAEGRRRERMEY